MNVRLQYFKIYKQGSKIGVENDSSGIFQIGTFHSLKIMESTRKITILKNFEKFCSFSWHFFRFLYKKIAIKNNSILRKISKLFESTIPQK